MPLTSFPIPLQAEQDFTKVTTGGIFRAVTLCFRDLPLGWVAQFEA